MGRAELIAAEALARIEEGAPADRILKRTLRAHPELDNDERRRVAELVHGVRCHLVRLAHLAERYPQLDRFALYDQRDGLAAEWPAEPVERLRVWASLPGFVATALWGAFAEEAFAVAETLNTPGPIAIRARGDREVLAARLTAEGMNVSLGRLAPSALRLSGRPDIRGSAAWREGAFEVQDEASQMVAVAVDARPGESVIDLCAGAGGKTLAMASSMNDTGALWACDVDPARLADLRVRLGRVGSGAVRIVDLRDSEPPGGADRVLVDAPCSAVGTWRRGPDRKWRVREPDVEAFARMQLELLRRARALVRVGGRIVYATCTLLPAENEDVAGAFLAEGGVEPVPVWPGESSAVTLRPDAFDTDGFFVAAFVRS